MSKTEDQEQLINRSWELVQEALTRGTLTLESQDPAKPSQRILDTESVIDLAKFFVQLKVKKPQLVQKPEDFDLKPTTGDEDETD